MGALRHGPKLALGVAVAAAAGGALAPSARAADVAAGTACVRSDFVNHQLEPLPLAASGFPAGATVTFKLGDQVAGSAVADAAGNAATNAASVPEPAGSRFQQTFSLTATDGITASAAHPLVVVRTDVSLPSSSRPRKTARFRAFGFSPGQTIYLHVRRRGKTKGTFRIGKAGAPCGNAVRKLHYMPLRSYRTGTYDYYFDQSKKYAKAAFHYRLKIRITRTHR